MSVSRGLLIPVASCYFTLVTLALGECECNALGSGCLSVCLSGRITQKLLLRLA